VKVNEIAQVTLLPFIGTVLYCSGLQPVVRLTRGTREDIFGGIWKHHTVYVYLLFRKEHVLLDVNNIT
jgi:hypothetical protein